MSSSTARLGYRPESQKSLISTDSIVLSNLSSGYQTRYNEEEHLLHGDSNRKPLGIPHTKIAATTLTVPFQHIRSTWTDTLKSWWTELALSALAAGLLIAIISILTNFHGKPQPSWTLGLNLNSLVALMATLLRSSILTVVEEVISQAKWLWQQTPGPLRDLVYFDEASRGPFGSLLLWTRISSCFGLPRLFRAAGSAVLASLVIVLSLAIGTFTQQSVKTVPCKVTVPGATASIAVTNGSAYQGTYMRYGAGVYDLEAPAKARVFRAFIEGNNDRLELVHGCSTGDCRFPEVAPGVTHTASGFCSKCLDTKSSVYEEARTVNYSENEYQGSLLRLPNGMQVGPVGLNYPGRIFESRLFANLLRNETNAFMIPEIVEDSQLSKIWNVSAATAHFLSLTISDCEVSSPVSNVSADRIDYDFRCPYPKLAANKLHRWNVVSANCALYPCVKDMYAYVRDGRLVEEIVEQTPIYPYDDASGATYTMVKTPCYLDGQLYDEQNISLRNGLNLGPCVYNVPFELWRAISREHWLPSLLGGYCWLGNMYGDDPETRARASCKSAQNGTDAWWLTSMYHQGNATFDSISKNMDDIATAITDSMRLSTITQYGLDDNTTISGTVWQSELCMEFRWPSLIFPGALILLSVVSLALILIARPSDGVHPPVWKSSILPLIYLQDQKIVSRLPSYSMDKIQRAADNCEAVLQQDEQQEWKLRVEVKDSS